jgi:hypothetical protein
MEADRLDPQSPPEPLGMTVAPSAFRHPPLMRQHDRRIHWRVAINLFGRLMLENRLESPCQTRNISPGGAALTTPVVGHVGERAVAYLDHIGRIEGEIVRLYDGGFAMTINATLHRKDTLAAKLTWLANRHELSLPEDRRHERVIPKTPLATTVCLPDGREFRATVIDMSLSGAAIAVKIKPSIGSPLAIAKLRALVVRHFDGGIAVEFATVQTATSLVQNLS